MRSHGDCPQNCIIFDRFRRFPVCSALEFIIPLSAARLKSRKIRAINAREARGEKSRASKQETATRQSFDILSHPPFSACEHPLRCLFCDKKVSDQLFDCVFRIFGNGRFPYFAHPKLRRARLAGRKIKLQRARKEKRFVNKGDGTNN